MKRKLALLSALLLLLCCTACAAKGGVSYNSTVPATPMEAPMAANADAEYVAYDAGEYAMMEEAAEGAHAATPAKQGSATGQSDADTRKIVYNADLSMTADDPAAVQATIVERAEALGGYLADSNTSNDDLGPVYCNATIKVPAQRLPELVAAAKTLGKVRDYQLSSDDITLQYYDIAARLKSAKAEEAQLLTILNECRTVEDILAVRASLAEVRSDIESYQGQINLWDNLTSYATLILYVSRTPQPEVAREKELLTIWKASDVWNRMSRGFVNSARFVVNAVSAVGIFLAVAVIPAAVLFLCVGLPIILVKKRKRARALVNGEELPPTAREKRRARKLAKRAAKAGKTSTQESPAGSEEP